MRSGSYTYASLTGPSVSFNSSLVYLATTLAANIEVKTDFTSLLSLCFRGMTEYSVYLVIAL